MKTLSCLAALLVVLSTSSSVHARSEEQLARRLDRMRVVVGHVDQSAPDGAVVFLGDSHTHRIAVSAVARDAVSLAYGGQTAEQLADAMPTYGSLRRAKAIVLLIGTNDLLRGEGDQLQERLVRIAKARPGSVPLVWTGVPPINGKAPKINLFIRQFCQRLPACTYVEPPTELLHRNVHMSPLGTAKWIDALRAALPEALRGPGAPASLRTAAPLEAPNRREAAARGDDADEDAFDGDL